MAFNRAGFTTAAKAMGYSDEEINVIATMKEAQSDNPTSQLEDIKLKQAQYNLNKDLNTPILTPEEKSKQEMETWKSQETFKSDIQRKQKLLDDTFTEAKEIEKKSRITKDLDLFEKNYLETGLRGPGLGSVPSNIFGLSPEAADFDSQREIMAYTIATSLADQKGQGVSNKDIEKWTKALPARSDTEKQAANKMNNIREMLANKLGTEKTTSSLGSKPPSSTQSVIMTGPDGKKYNVPSNKVDLFKQNGYK